MPPNPRGPWVAVESLRSAGRRMQHSASRPLGHVAGTPLSQATPVSATSHRRAPAATLPPLDIIGRLCLLAATRGRPASTAGHATCNAFETKPPQSHAAAGAPGLTSVHHCPAQRFASPFRGALRPSGSPPRGLRPPNPHAASSASTHHAASVNRISSLQRSARAIRLSIDSECPS